jgi:parvulin-like peptidyl-prolyl isomerase
MSKRHEKEPAEEVKREMTRKEELLRHRDRERHKKLYTFVGIALGLALALVLVGVVYQFLIVPNTAAAKVGDVSISTAEFQQRVRFEKSSLENQMFQMQQLEQQFGGQGFFQTQIAQIQATLASPFSLGSQALDGMIEDVLIAKDAAARGITVTDEEVDQALREEVANAQGLVTESQAAATATAAVAATATAAEWTPTPTATVDPNAAITETAAVPTPVQPPPASVITETAYTQGLGTLEQSLAASSGLSINQYREIIRARLLRDKLSEVISAETVTPTEEQVHARHILLTVAEPTPSAPLTATDTLTSEVDAGVNVTATEGVTEAAEAVATVAATVAASAAVTPATVVTGTDAVTATLPVTPSSAVTGSAGVTGTRNVTATTAVSPAVVAAGAVTNTAAVTSTEPVTAAAGVTATAGVTPSAAVTTTADVTATAPITAAGEITGTVGITATEAITGSRGPYPDAEALALANELRARILAGEDFAALAQAYSDDTGSGANGGDLGWFGRGRMVAPFEEAAFSLPVGEVSEPVKTDFGYHLIEVLERDDARAKDEAQLQQEQAEAFQTWLREQLASDQIERPGDLTSLLPPGL